VARRARSNQSQTIADERRESPLGDGRYHVVQIELDDVAAPLLAGARGRAKIATFDSTIGELLLTRLRRTFQRVF
jgi:hypothetical protein